MAGVGGALVDALAGAGGKAGRHPVEEGAVVLGPGEGAHLRPHGREHDPHAVELFAQLADCLAHRRQRLFLKAGADADPEAVAGEVEALDVGGDLVGRPAVEGDDADAEVDSLGRSGELGEGLEALGAGVVVGPDGVVAELLALGRERAGDLGIEAGGDAEGAAHASARSSSATHSMCGVCGNMSTGLTRRSLYPASVSWAAFGASVVGLQET